MVDCVLNTIWDDRRLHESSIHVCVTSGTNSCGRLWKIEQLICCVVCIAEQFHDLFIRYGLVAYQIHVCWQVTHQLHTLLDGYTSGAHVLPGYTLGTCNVGRLHFCYMSVDKTEIFHTMLTCRFPLL